MPLGVRSLRLGWWLAAAPGVLLGWCLKAHASDGDNADRQAVAAGLALGSGPSFDQSAPDAARGAFLSMRRSVHSMGFWWPTVVVERGSTHVTGVRSIDETRFGLSLAYRSRTLSPHLRALLSPSIGAPHNLAAMAGAGLRVHFALGSVPLSYGVGLSAETRLRDSLWLGYATPIEVGTALYRGESAEHFVFVGARRTMTGALINSFLLDPNGYDNENSADRLAELREEHAWQLYVSVGFGRRIE